MYSVPMFSKYTQIEQSVIRISLNSSCFTADSKTRVRTSRLQLEKMQFSRNTLLSSFRKASQIISLKSLLNPNGSVLQLSIVCIYTELLKQNKQELYTETVNSYTRVYSEFNSCNAESKCKNGRILLTFLCLEHHVYCFHHSVSS